MNLLSWNKGSLSVEIGSDSGERGMRNDRDADAEKRSA
jgi:hypothetical protein